MLAGGEAAADNFQQFNFQHPKVCLDDVKEKKIYMRDIFKRD